ncbi:MAG TPA: replication initiator, partial [Pedococcus sp.]|nr:replication initiator [Pedococcus sp.]
MAAREAIGTPLQSADATAASGSAAPAVGTRAERSRLPLARHVVEAAAVSHGVCVHPVPVRRIDPETGGSVVVDVPCGATLESKCPPCAQRARSLRIAQCRTGWHLETEPVFEPDDPTHHQIELATLRADLEAALVRARAEGLDEAPILASIQRVEEAL